MIELTPEQRQVVDQGDPVRVVDPDTHGAYVVVRAEVYERLAGPLPRSPDDPLPQVTPMMLRSQQAFWRDLPELLKMKSKKLWWVAYHGDERIGFSKDDAEIYQRCLQRGLRRGDFYVALIREEPTPPWEVEEIEMSLFECEDDPSPLLPQSGQ